MSVKTNKQEQSALSTKKVGMFQETWGRLYKQPIAMVSLGIVVIIILLAAFADVIYDFQASCVTQDIANRLQGFSWEHPLGTDMYGRDMLARIIYGIRSALQMGFVGSAITGSVATLLAVVASYYGGRVDNIIMRLLDILACIPALVMAIAICAGLGGGMWQLVIALAVSGLASGTRMIRSKGLSVANSGYIESTTALGAGTAHILFKCMLPNLVDMIIIVTTGQVAMYIMMGTTLSFIGLGVKSPTPEWGLMLNENISKMQLYPAQVIIPAVAIVVTTLSISTLGDYLRDAFDPKLKGKG